MTTEITRNSESGDDPGDGGDPGGGSTSSGGMMRSSAVMAVGTTVSRVTGFLRTAVLAAAIGTQLLGDAYNTANVLPFVINDLLLQGIMASVFIPFLVKRRKRDSDGGAATENRLFTSAILLLAAVTITAILAAEGLIWLYADSFRHDQFQVSVYLARFLLAQIFFVGLSGLLSAMLNTRNRFGAPVWAPVLNNLVIIAVGGLFIWVAPAGRSPANVTDGELTLLGLGTATGMAMQAAALLVALWRTGFRWRPRLDLRGSGLGEALRSAGWMFLFTGMNQIRLLITAKIATRAGVLSVEGGHDVGAGLTSFTYSQQLFQLPYAIVAMSLITVLLPHMSSHAEDGRWDEVRAGFSRTLRVSSLFLVPLGLAMAVYSTQIAIVVFARGSTSTADAANIGTVLTVMALGLVPFTIFQLMLRVFYALGDTRTPALISVANVAVHGLIGVLALLTLPPHLVVAGLAAGYMLSFVVGLCIGGTILSRRLDGLDGRQSFATLLRLHLAAVPSVAVALAVLWPFTAYFGEGWVTNIGAPLTGCVVGALMFLLFARLLRIRELEAALNLVRARLRR